MRIIINNLLTMILYMKATQTSEISGVSIYITQKVVSRMLNVF
jgi:hypothetical protein